ncbi:hypothetical protein [Aminobacter ciceronei]|uniref:Secreted protein n=1 Tax=Aminobacter ciceronei TaxID=150723 RepID=A0ABR6CHC2_9HYPH|nr:hypothetical protein [Aminobacter ciceronei]MBA8910264.1 hypothetical protein [Aminobacter ciceronei]MBA9023998.1 hypothetical protein [Aminobacter ciceronei]
MSTALWTWAWAKGVVSAAKPSLQPKASTSKTTIARNGRGPTITVINRNSPSSANGAEGFSFHMGDQRHNSLSNRPEQAAIALNLLAHVGQCTCELHEARELCFTSRLLSESHLVMTAISRVWASMTFWAGCSPICYRRSLAWHLPFRADVAAVGLRDLVVLGMATRRIVGRVVVGPGFTTSNS